MYSWVYGYVDTRRRYVCPISDTVVPGSVCGLLSEVVGSIKIFSQSLRLQLKVALSTIQAAVYCKNNGECAELRLCFHLRVFRIFAVRARLPFTQAAES